MAERVSGVRGSRTGRPIMAALDLLGRRWMLRVLWQLRDGPLTFRALREQCDAVSPSVLNTRLAEMRAAGLVEAGAGAGADPGYALTSEGTRLLDVLSPLHAWATRWAAADPQRVAALSSRAAAPGAAARQRAARRPPRSR
jgi:DNA-binding HxlR family transcriptional regulator